jgi:predicted GNAT family N-acyltransferase
MRSHVVAGHPTFNQRVDGSNPSGLTINSMRYIPLPARKFVPRYPLVAATLIGRLAIAQERQGEGLDTLLLADALRRAHASAAIVGSSMVVVDAISEQAAAFYEATGFIRLPDSLRLVLPTATIAKLF